MTALRTIHSSRLVGNPRLRLGLSKSGWAGWIIAAILATGVAGSSNAAVTTISLAPAADTMVSATNPANNYGAAGAISIAAPGLTKGEFQTLLKFDLSTEKAYFDSTYGVGQWTIQSATLGLTAQLANNPIFNTPAAGQFTTTWMQNDTWVEGTGTPSNNTTAGLSYNSLPGFISGNDQSLGTNAFNGATSGPSTFALSLASGFLTDLNNGNLTSLRLFAADGTLSGVFNSHNFATSANWPALTITATSIPEPTMISAILGVVFLTRRPKR